MDVWAEYTYDAWGKVLTATGNLAAANPLRYRGYFYDEELLIMKRSLSVLLLFSLALFCLTSCGSSAAGNSTAAPDSAAEELSEPVYTIDETAPTGTIHAWDPADIPAILNLTDGPAIPAVFSYDCPSSYKRLEIGCELYQGSEKKLNTVLIDYAFTAEGDQSRTGDILISPQNRYVSYKDTYRKDMEGHDQNGNTIQTFKDMEVWNWGNEAFPVLEGITLPHDFGGIQAVLCGEDPIHSGERTDLLFLTYAFDTFDSIISTPLKEAILSEGVEKALSLLQEDTISYVFYIRFL
jgi:hypothetical protein